jgi:hypothetical protein
MSTLLTFLLLFAPSVALAYPGATAVSLGTNPVFSHGGNMGIETETTTVFLAPSDQIMVITDIALGMTQTSRSCEVMVAVQFLNDADEVLGEFAIGMADLYNHPGTAQGYHFNSGIPIQPGDSLRLKTTRTYRECGAETYQLRYTISGYKAQP